MSKDGHPSGGQDRSRGGGRWRGGGGRGRGNRRGRGRGGGWQDRGQNSYHRGRQGSFHDRSDGSGRGERSDSKENHNRGRSNPRWHSHRSRASHTSVTQTRQRTETEVGITEYVSDHPGFSGIIKERYSDFQVNEIDLDGKVAKLTSFAIPEEVVKAETHVEKHHLIPEDTWTKLQKLVETTSDESEPVKVEVTDMTKDDRRDIHSCVKNTFGQNIISNTEETDGKKFISFKHCSKSGSRDRRQEWPKTRDGEYLYFIVSKKNMDTTETINLISMQLRLRPNAITYAGTKDRRGITSQWMCLRRGEPKRLSSASRSLRSIWIGNFCYRPKLLQLGNLKGNQFRIVLRNVLGSDEQIEVAMASLRDKGFINYYGLQRFGTHSGVPTYEIGKTLLQGDWKKAVELILKPREDGNENGNDSSAACKEWWESRDAGKAKEKLHRGNFSLEGALINGLAEHGPNDFVNALSAIPRNTRILYLHAYQSYVWNRIVSRRVREYGLKPMVGDLVLVDPTSSNVDSIVDEEAPENEEEKSDEIKEIDMANLVRCIEEGDLSEVKMEDIVLPLPGYNIVYPNNVLKDWYLEMLKEDGLTHDGLKQTVKQYSVGGSYRPLLARAENVSWQILHHNDPKEDLLLSDWEESQGKNSFVDVPDGKQKALIIRMNLHSSTYATMALREVMKIDTSATNQMKLSSEASEVLKTDSTELKVRDDQPVDMVKCDEMRDEKASEAVDNCQTNLTTAKEETKIPSTDDTEEELMKGVKTESGDGGCTEEVEIGEALKRKNEESEPACDTEVKKIKTE